MIRHAWKNVPFYRDVMRERNLTPESFKTLDDLRLLPLHGNERFRDDPAIFNSEDVDVENDVLMRAGGYKRIYWSRKASLQWFSITSRTRAVKNELLGREAGYVEVYLLPREDSNPRMNDFWRENLWFRGRAGNRLWLDINRPYEKILNELNRIKPDIVYCYGSQTERFFKFLDAEGMEFFPPRIWCYGSDMMNPGMRSFIESKWGCIVYSAYNLNEMGVCSFECERRDGFHLNIDACHVRIVDEDGNDVPRGTTGEVVISNLINKATVILNYRTGDRARMAVEECGCGRNLPLLKDLEGRICDTIYCDDGTEFSSALLTVPAADLLRNVRDFQIVQERRGHVCWDLISFPGTERNKVEAGLCEITGRIMPPSGQVEVRWVNSVQTTPRLKRILVLHRFQE